MESNLTLRNQITEIREKNCDEPYENLLNCKVPRSAFETDIGLWFVTVLF